jgi:hypothetical protein
LTVAIFAAHLADRIVHTIQFAMSDGLEDSVAALTYIVQEPNNTGPPSIALSGPTEYPFAQPGPTADRSFEVNVSDPDGGVLSVSYRIDEGE